MLKEKEDARAELYDASNQLEDIKKKFNTLKNEHHSITGDLERLRTEHFVSSQRLNSIEKEHEEEVQSYKEEIEELHNKLKAVEKKLEEAKEAADHLSGSEDFKMEEGLTGEDLGLGDLPQSDRDMDFRRPSTARMSTMIREKRISFNAQGPSGQSDFKSQLIKDVQQKELLDRNAELQQQVDDLKLANQKLKTEIDQLSSKLKEETRNLELAKKKIETKNLELENYRKKTLEDTDKFTIALNEVNEELDNRDEQIKKLRRQIRSMQGNSATPISPVRQAK